MTLLTCRVPWPACPNCYTGTVEPRGVAWGCRDCGQTWQGPPVGAPCGRPPTHALADATTSVLACDAHAAWAHKLLPHAEIKKLRIDRKAIEL